MQALNTFLEALAREIVNPLILLLIAVAGLLLVWGIFNFIRNAGESEARKEGQQAILWGIIGLAVMFGAYGIINIVLDTASVPQENRGVLKNRQ